MAGKWRNLKYKQKFDLLHCKSAKCRWKDKNTQKPTFSFKPSRLETDFFFKSYFLESLKSTVQAVVEDAGAAHLLCTCTVQKEFVNAPRHVALQGFLSLDEEQKGDLHSISDTCSVFSYLVMLTRCKTDAFSGISSARAHVVSKANKIVWWLELGSPINAKISVRK